MGKWRCDNYGILTPHIGKLPGASQHARGHEHALFMLRGNKLMTANEFALSDLFDLEVSIMLVMSHAQCMPAAARPSTLAGEYVIGEDHKFA